MRLIQEKIDSNELRVTYNHPNQMGKKKLRGAKYTHGSSIQRWSQIDHGNFRISVNGGNRGVKVNVGQSSKGHSEEFVTALKRQSFVFAVEDDSDPLANLILGGVVELRIVALTVAVVQ